jgi:hypothetical protein
MRNYLLDPDGLSTLVVDVKNVVPTNQHPTGAARTDAVGSSHDPSVTDQGATTEASRFIRVSIVKRHQKRKLLWACFCSTDNPRSVSAIIGLWNCG